MNFFATNQPITPPPPSARALLCITNVDWALHYQTTAKNIHIIHHERRFIATVKQCAFLGWSVPLWVCRCVVMSLSICWCRCSLTLFPLPSPSFIHTTQSRLPPEVNRILYVRNLPFRITSEELYDIFGKYGAVYQIRLGEKSRDTRGTAFVGELCLLCIMAVRYV